MIMTIKLRFYIEENIHITNANILIFLIAIKTGK